MLGTNTHGALQTDFEGGHNEWMSFDEALKKDKKFKSFEQEIHILDAKDWLQKQTVVYSKEKF